MSDTDSTSERKSLSLTRPRRLELKKTVETGQVRQSFSHGRSKTVQVEVRKKRSISREDEQPRTETPPIAAAVVAEPVAEKPPVEAPSDEVSPKARVVLRQLTDDEKAHRHKAASIAKKADNEARRMAKAEAEVRAEDEERRRREEEAADKRAEDEEQRKQSDEDVRRKAEEDAARRLPAFGNPEPIVLDILGYPLEEG